MKMSTSQGHFEYDKMPFGLKNALATFQSMMDNAFRSSIGTKCFKFQSDMFDNMSIIVLTQIHIMFVHFFGIGSVKTRNKNIFCTYRTKHKFTKFTDVIFRQAT